MINKGNSGVMHVRNHSEVQIDGYPTVQHYKYLGVVLDNQGTIKEHVKVLTKRVKYLNR